MVSEARWKAWGMLCVLAGFSISINWLNVRMSYVGRDFMTALTLKDKDEFVRQLYWYLLAFAGATTLAVFYRYCEERLGLLWRRWLSVWMLGQYFSGRAYYRIGSYEGIDNPDQRVVEDVRTFAATTLSFLLIIFNSFMTLYAFMRILWGISIYLPLAAVAYAIFGLLATYILGRPLIGLNFEQLKKDADYRYKLINIRDNAEPIAFWHGEARELSRTRQRLKSALRNMLHIINWNRNLNFFTIGYNYLVTILPTVIVAPLYLSGKIEFGVVTQASFAFGHVLGALSIIVTNFGSLSTFAAVISRLGTFVEAVRQGEQENVCDVDSKKTVISVNEGLPLRFERVTVVTPKRDQVILRDLNLEVDRSLLITGQSGCGKSSVRTIAGLWYAGEGTLQRPPLSQSLMLPQRPYMLIGTFRSQFEYPCRVRGLTDKQILNVIETVKLSNTLERVGGLNSIHDWSNMLSNGEQQRVAFARLILLIVLT